MCRRKQSGGVSSSYLIVPVRGSGYLSVPSRLVRRLGFSCRRASRLVPSRGRRVVGSSHQMSGEASKEAGRAVIASSPHPRQASRQAGGRTGRPRSVGVGLVLSFPRGGNDTRGGRRASSSSRRSPYPRLIPSSNTVSKRKPGKQTGRRRRGGLGDRIPAGKRRTSKQDEDGERPAHIPIITRPTGFHLTPASHQSPRPSTSRTRRTTRRRETTRKTTTQHAGRKTTRPDETGRDRTRRREQ